MLLTFVIPAYNAQNYIERCIRSILNLNAEEYAIEIVVIDDGSDDRTVKICKKIIETDKRVRLISKENGGVSSARNRGILEANGQYIMFIDADDEFVSDSFFAVYQVLKKKEYDIIALDYSMYSSDGKYIGSSHLNFPEIIDAGEIAARFINYPVAGVLRKQKNYLGAKVYQYIIRKSLISGNCIRFPETIGYAEDTCFLYTVMQYSPSIRYMNKVCYKYYVISGSASHCCRARFSEEISAVFEYICENSRMDFDALRLRSALYNLELQYWVRYLKYDQYKNKSIEILSKIDKNILKIEKGSGLHFRIYRYALQTENSYFIYLINCYGEKLHRISNKIRSIIKKLLLKTEE